MDILNNNSELFTQKNGNKFYFNKENKDKVEELVQEFTLDVDIKNSDIYGVEMMVEVFNI